MLGLYQHRETSIHRLRAGIKLIMLFVLAALAFATHSFLVLAAIAGLVSVGYAIARIGARTAFAQIRPALFVLALIVALHLVMGEWRVAALVFSRFLIVIAAASLVTLTTRASDMVDALGAGLAPLRRIGIDPAPIALCLSMAIRFVPVMANEIRAIREVQAARGLERSLVAVAVPAILRGLRMADTVAEALHARGYGEDAAEGTAEGVSIEDDDVDCDALHHAVKKPMQEHAHARGEHQGNALTPPSPAHNLIRDDLK